MSEILGPLMFAVVLIFIFTGYPVAFALAGTALLFAALGVQSGLMDWQLLYAFPERVFGVMSNYVLLAVPFFIFMGTMLEKSRLAEDLLLTVGQLFGRVRGGLALAVVGVGTLLAAATGVVGASVVAMGLISLPVMLRYRYSPAFATGVIAASGTLGQIIPPSVVLVVLGDQMGVSVGDLFLGAFVPGLMLAGLFAIFVAVASALRPELAPALPKEALPANRRLLLVSVVKVMVPPLVLILVVLGSIFFGVATPTEAGALGAVGALALAAINRRLTWPTVRETMGDTARLTSMVVFLLLGSTLFALVFRGVNGDLWLEHHLTNLPGGALGLIVVTNVVIFALGFFIDFFEIAFIVVPLMTPAARALGIDLVWFGVMLGMNLQTSFLTPPFGFSLFYLRGVTPPEVKTIHIYRGVVPFVLIQLVALVLVIVFPQIVALGR